MAMDDLASQIDFDDLFHSFPRDDDLADLFGDHSHDFEEFNFVASNSVFDGTQAWDTLQDPAQLIQDFAAVGTSSCNFDHRELCGADTGFDASTAESQLDQWHAGFENDSFSSERQWGHVFEVADPVPLPTLPSIVNEVGGGSLANSICKPKRKKLVMQDTVSKQKPESLTMKDSMFIFHSDVKKKFKIPRRKRFETDRRKEVALNRAIGACVQCKVRKESVYKEHAPSNYIKLTKRSAVLKFPVKNVSKGPEVLPLGDNSVPGKNLSPHASTTLVRSRLEKVLLPYF